MPKRNQSIEFTNQKGDVEKGKFVKEQKMLRGGKEVVMLKIINKHNQKQLINPDQLKK